MTISTLDGLITALGSGAQHRSFLKTFIPQAAGGWTALWNQAGFPGAAATPSSGAAGDVPTDATDGAIRFTNPGGGLSTYLARLSYTTTSSGVLFLYDRLWQNSGLSATSTSAQTVNSVALTRPDANGVDVEAWFQVYTGMGAGTPTINLSYTDSDNNSGNTALALGVVAGANAGRCYPFQLAAGDTGVKSIQTYTASATMTSGTFGLVLRRKLAMLPMAVAQTGALVDPITGGLPVIPDDACLELVYQSPSTVLNTMLGALSLVQG